MDISFVKGNVYLVAVIVVRPFGNAYDEISAVLGKMNKQLRGVTQNLF